MTDDTNPGLGGQTGCSGGSIRRFAFLPACSALACSVLACALAAGCQSERIPVVVTAGPPPEKAPVEQSRYDQCVRYAVEIWCPLRSAFPDDAEARMLLREQKAKWRRPGDPLPGCEIHGELASQQFVDGFERCMFDSLFGRRIPQNVELGGKVAVERLQPEPTAKSEEP